MLQLAAALLIAAAPAPPAAAAPRTPIPAAFESVGPDRAAIEALLAAYTRAVSAKDRVLFESLLLNTDIPFSGVDQAVRAGGAPGGARNYADFRRGVFAGPPFTQRFQDVRIRQDGPLADVSLVFVNSAPDGSNWGWKTLQLLKVGGRWKIASEFYTNHA